MLLRRITKHVKDQNWFAVFLDFLIVVVGILIAFQITNWNEGRNNGQLRMSYLERLESDLTQTIGHLSKNQDTVDQKIEIIDRFVAKLNDRGANEGELIRSTADYLTRGTNMSDFKVFRSTFDELRTSGNLEILQSDKLSETLMTLNTNYAGRNEDLLVNTDWILPAEAELTTAFDWFRFDELTMHLFPSKSSTQIASEIRLHEDKLRRHAALHYWVAHSLKRNYRGMIEQSQDALSMVQHELEKR